MTIEKKLPQWNFLDKLILEAPFALTISWKREPQTDMKEHLKNVKIWEKAVEMSLMPKTSKVIDLTEEIRQKVQQATEAKAQK